MITKVSILYMYESCQRHNYWVQLTNEHNQTIEAAYHRSGSIYTNFEGFSRDEARDRALIDANTWADFLCLVVEPYIEDGKLYEPSMILSTYSYQMHV